MHNGTRVFTFAQLFHEIQLPPHLQKPTFTCAFNSGARPLGSRLSLVDALFWMGSMTSFRGQSVLVAARAGVCLAVIRIVATAVGSQSYASEL